jgi:hypothetical protein
MRPCFHWAEEQRWAGLCASLKESQGPLFLPASLWLQRGHAVSPKDAWPPDGLRRLLAREFGLLGWSVSGIARLRVRLKPGVENPPHDATIDPCRLVAQSCWGSCDTASVKPTARPSLDQRQGWGWESEPCLVIPESLASHTPRFVHKPTDSPWRAPISVVYSYGFTELSIFIATLGRSQLNFLRIAGRPRSVVLWILTGGRRNELVASPFWRSAQNCL